MPWFKHFSEPIILKDSRELHTLRDAASYIAEFSTAEQALPNAKLQRKR